MTIAATQNLTDYCNSLVLPQPNTGYNTIGFGAFKPFIILHVLQRLTPNAHLLFLDCNVLKHWNLAAYAPLAGATTAWLLRVAGREGVAMPRENPSTRHGHICSAAALSGMEARWESDCDSTKGWTARDLAALPSPHSNRIAVRAEVSPQGLNLWSTLVSLT